MSVDNVDALGRPRRSVRLFGYTPDPHMKHDLTEGNRENGAGLASPSAKLSPVKLIRHRMACAVLGGPESPNKAAAVDGGIAPLFQIERARPAATEPQRWQES